MNESPRDLVPRPPGEPVNVEAQHVDALGADTLGLTRGRKIAALVIASISDAISVATLLAPPVQIVVDVVTAGALFAVLGFRWPLLPVLVVEAVPGLATFPTWMLVVGVMVGVTPTAKS